MVGFGYGVLFLKSADDKDDQSNDGNNNKNADAYAEIKNTFYDFATWKRKKYQKHNGYSRYLVHGF